MRAVASTFAVVGLMLLAVPAAATDSIMVYGPEQAGMEEQQQATALLEGSVGQDQLPSSAVHILDLPFPSPDPVWIAGDARVVPCTDPALEATDLSALLTQAVEHIDGLDYEAGKRVLDQAIIALPCSQQQVDRQVLIDIYYFRGIASFNMGDRDGAKQNFYYSLAIEKDKKWDTNYPPDPQQVFLLAKDDAMSLDRVEIGYDVRGADVTRFSIDGVAHDVERSEVQRLVPGMHLVQYVSGGTPYSRLVEVRQDGPASLVTRQGLTAAVAGGPDAPGMLPAARASLRSLVQSRNLKRAYVVILNPDATANIYRYDETYTAMALQVSNAAEAGDADAGGDDKPKGQDKKPKGQDKKPRQDGTKGARVALDTSDSGGGITLHPAGLLLAHWEGYFGLSLRGHIRVYKGLEVDLGGGVGLTDWWDDKDEVGGLVVLPFVRAGVRYRFGSKAVRPYAGAVFLLNFWLDSYEEEGVWIEEFKASPGVGAIGGIEIHLTKALYLGVDVLGGWAYSPWVTAQFGVGFRF